MLDKTTKDGCKTIMRLEKLRIKGFRNFNDTEIVFQEKSLIIGANDVGKTNLIYAIFRICEKCRLRRPPFLARPSEKIRRRRRGIRKGRLENGLKN